MRSLSRGAPPLKRPCPPPTLTSARVGRRSTPPRRKERSARRRRRSNIRLTPSTELYDCLRVAASLPAGLHRVRTGRQGRLPLHCKAETEFAAGPVKEVVASGGLNADKYQVVIPRVVYIEYGDNQRIADGAVSDCDFPLACWLLNAMNLTRLIVAIAALILMAGSAFGADLDPSLGKRGKLLLEEKFEEGALPKGWNKNTGVLSVGAGVLHASQ